MWWYLLAGMAIGVGVSVIFVAMYLRKLRIGYLRIDRSIPEDRPYAFMELTSDDFLRYSNGRKIVLEIKQDNYISSRK